jgi:hypothetical protein
MNLATVLLPQPAGPVTIQIWWCSGSGAGALARVCEAVLVMVCAGVAAGVRFSYDSIMSGGWRAGDGLLWIHGAREGAGERSRVREEAVVEWQAKRLERWVG